MENNIVERLQQLSELLANGLITQEEFTAIKKELLGQASEDKDVEENTAEESSEIIDNDALDLEDEDGAEWQEEEPEVSDEPVPYEESEPENVVDFTENSEVELVDDENATLDQEDQEEPDGKKAARIIILSIIAVIIVCIIIGIVAGNSGSSSSTSSTSSSRTTTSSRSTSSSVSAKPTESVLKQRIINKCCSYSNVDSIKGLTIGTFDSEWSSYKGEWVTTVKGYYYPVDEYGNMKSKVQFTMTFEGYSVKSFKVS